jgi:hypothetical protein
LPAPKTPCCLERPKVDRVRSKEGGGILRGNPSKKLLHRTYGQLHVRERERAIERERERERESNRARVRERERELFLSTLDSSLIFLLLKMKSAPSANTVKGDEKCRSIFAFFFAVCPHSFFLYLRGDTTMTRRRVFVTKEKLSSSLFFFLPLSLSPRHLGKRRKGVISLLWSLR